MRTGLTPLQTNILDQDVYQDFSWLFEVDLSDNGSINYYWSTKKKTYSGQTYSDIDGGDAFVVDFTPIKMQRAYIDSGIMAPSSIKIAVDNKGSSLTPSTFEGAAITVRLVIKADLVVKETSDITLTSDVTLESSNIAETEIVSWSFVVKTAYTLYQTLYLQCVDWLSNYMTGDYPNTPLISTLWTAANVPDDNICVPKIWGTCYFPIRWTKADVTADDLYVLGEYATGEMHTITECRDPINIGKGVYLESDTNHTFTVTENKQANDGNYYSTATFVITDGGSNIFWERNIHPDMPCKYSNSATVDTKNPIEIIKEVLLDFGISDAKIDNSSYLTAKETWRSRGLRFNAPMFYKRPRSEVLAHLLMQCNTTLLIRDKIYFKVNSTTSQHTINNSWVLKMTEVGEGTFRYSPMNLTDYKDSGHVLYRPSNKSIDDRIKLLLPTKILTNYISDITLDCSYIEDSNHVQKIGVIALQKLLFQEATISILLKPKCLELEVGDMVTIEGANYNALSNYDVLIDSMAIGRDGSVSMGLTSFRNTLDDWGDVSTSTVTVVEDDSSGGFYSVYGGRETPGEANGVNLIETDGTIKFPAGEDIILTGSDGDPSFIRWQGTSYEAYMGLNVSGSEFHIIPNTDNQTTLYIGQDEGGAPWDTSQRRWLDIFLEASDDLYLYASGATTNSLIHLDPNYIYFEISQGTQLSLSSGVFKDHSSHKGTDLGASDRAWDDAYADDWNNVADFYFLDDYHDLSVIELIKPSGKIDKRTGLPLIDDNSLPEWMLTKDKESGEICRDPDNKPYISLKLITSLLLGGIRELIKWIKSIDERLKKLEERENYGTNLP